MNEIIELDDRTMEWLSNVLNRAIENNRTVKVCIEGGGLKVKSGESIWTPPLGKRIN